jgi:hypothetical protein
MAGFGSDEQLMVRAFLGISLRSFGHRIEFQIALRRDAECVRDAIEECEHRRDVYSLRNLRLSPSVRPQFIYILCSRAIGGLRHLLYILQQRTLRIAETGFIQISLSDGLNCLLVGSLDTQEVSMRVQSIWTAIEPRHPACDRFLRPAIQVSC